MLLGLRTAIYPVDDLLQAKLWYEKVVGVKPYFEEPFYVGFSVGGFELGLIPNPTSGIIGPQPLWGVENVKVEFEHLPKINFQNQQAKSMLLKAWGLLPATMMLGLIVLT